MKHKTLAIPIRIVNWSDSSQVLSLFTRGHGIVEAVAKGAHRMTNAFQGPFDLAVLSEVVFAERPPERGLSIVTEGAVLDGFPGIRRSWERWAAAAYLLEYLRAVGTAGEPSEDLFDGAVRTLGAIGEGSASEGPRERLRIAGHLLAFEVRAIRILGLQGPMTSCAGCGRPWSGADRPVFFSAGSGGILCGKCRGAEPERSGIVVGGSAVRALAEIASGAGEPTIVSGSGQMPLEAPAGREGPSPHAPSSEGLFEDLRALIREMRVFLLEREFKMLKYLPEVV